MSKEYIYWNGHHFMLDIRYSMFCGYAFGYGEYVANIPIRIAIESNTSIHVQRKVIFGAYSVPYI